MNVRLTGYTRNHKIHNNHICGWVGVAPIRGKMEENVHQILFKMTKRG